MVRFAALRVGGDDSQDDNRCVPGGLTLCPAATVPLSPHVGMHLCSSVPVSHHPGPNLATSRRTALPPKRTPNHHRASTEAPPSPTCCRCRSSSQQHENQQRLLTLAAHLASLNRAPDSVQASPEALAVWLQELYCRAYALQVVARYDGDSCGARWA